MKKQLNLFFFFLGMSVYFSVLLICSRSLAQDNLRVHILDAGYADAIVIQFPDGSIMLIDAGEADFSEKISEYLNSLGASDIHTAVITHPHKGHFGGYYDLMDFVKIRRVLINGDRETEEGYYRLLDKFQNNNVPVFARIGEGRLEHIPDGIDVHYIHPLKLDGSPNDNSTVLWIEYGDTSLLFTSDIGKKVQGDLIKRRPEILKSNLVTIPHHGLDISESFAESFQNTIFVASTAENEWGSIQEGDLEKLRGDIYRTDRDGSIVVESDGVSVQVIKPEQPKLNLIDNE